MENLSCDTLDVVARKLLEPALLAEALERVACETRERSGQEKLSLAMIPVDRWIELAYEIYLERRGSHHAD